MKTILTQVRSTLKYLIGGLTEMNPETAVVEMAEKRKRLLIEEQNLCVSDSQ